MKSGRLCGEAKSLLSTAKPNFFSYFGCAYVASLLKTKSSSGRRAGTLAAAGVRGTGAGATGIRTPSGGITVQHQVECDEL